MSDKEPVDFSIKLSGIYWRKKPVARIYIDDKFIQEIVVQKEYQKDSEIIKFTEELAEGDHKLVIDFVNKDNNDTILENGKIVKDMLLSIDEILIDDIELGYLALLSGKFYVNKLVRPEQPDVIEKIPLIFGFPGRWEMNFTCPTYIWFLENL